MNKLLLKLSFLISLIFLASYCWALPPCPSFGYKHNCYGSHTFPSGNIYVGEWQNDSGNGRGTYTHKSGNVYIGQWKNLKRHGYGRETWAEGHKYLGEFKNNKRDGHGTYTWVNGAKYEGEWKKNKKHGQGKYTYANGKIEEGIWKYGKFLYSQKKPTSNSNFKIEGYKIFCSEIGFTPGTEKFGECVVEAMKKG